jgi:hypothetical protein
MLNTEKVYFSALKALIIIYLQDDGEKNEWCFWLHQKALRLKRVGYLGTRQAIHPQQLIKLNILLTRMAKLNKILIKWLEI